jgi:multidrug efflux pump subunit AcrB
VYKSLLTNHPLVNILFTVVLAMGVLSYASMPRERDPEINFNWVNINTILPGASAPDVEELVTGPLEDSIRNVRDVRWVISSTRESSSNILVRFNEMSDRQFDKRVNDLRRELQNKANDELPEEAEDPLILEVTSSNGFPTAMVVVEGQANDEQLRMQARLIKIDLERFKGIDQVISIGLHDPELQVELIPDKLAQHGLMATDVADSLRQSFKDVFAGKMRVSGNEWLVRLVGTTEDPEILSDYQFAPSQRPDRMVALDQVARIRRGRKEATQLVSFDDRPAVGMSISKVAYTNTLDLIDEIKDYIRNKNEQLEGTGVKLVLADDQTLETRDAIRIMQNNAMLGLSLVLGVCWLFLGLRIATMVTLGILFSITGTFWALDVAGHTMNVAVLLGIVIVLGMLVDDAVVVVEAMYYRLQRGARKLDAALGALREVGRPVSSAVATTMAAFLPLMLLTGIIGQFMFVIPFVVTVGLAISLVEAFWILPAHIMSFSHHTDKRASLDNWRTRWTHRIRVTYTKMLCYVMRRPGRFLGAGVLAVLLAVSTVLMGLVKFEFFTNEPMRLLYVNLDMPADSPLEETLEQLIIVEKRVRTLLREGEARSFTSNAGIKFSDVEPMYSDQYGQIMVSLNPRGKDGRSVVEIIDSIRDEVSAIRTDGEISLTVKSNGPPKSKPISVKVRSDDFGELRDATDAILSIAAKIPGVHDLADNDVQGRSELVLKLDYKAIRRAGLTPGKVTRLLRLSMDGEIVAFLRDKGEKVELRVRGTRHDVQDIHAILNDPIALPSGGLTTIGALTTSEISRSRGTIRHYNLRRSITVEAELDTSLINTVEANRRIAEEWENIKTKFPNTDLDFTGELDDIQESLDSMGGLFLLGLGLIYLIISAQFRSYFQPFLILVTIPMAFTGVVFGLLLTGNPMSLWTLYGVIALTGISVNSAIVLIDAANARIRSGMRPLHATVYAARRRVIPILMTTSTTIAGLFSLAIGLGGKSLLWGPVASSIVAGLGVASLMTLFIIPTLYRAFMRGHDPEEFRRVHHVSAPESFSSTG